MSSIIDDCTKYIVESLKGKKKKKPGREKSIRRGFEAAEIVCLNVLEVLVLLTIVFGTWKEMRLRNKKTRIERYRISCRIHCLFCEYECH